MALGARPDPDRPTILDAGGPNAVAVTLGIVGDEWTLWMLQLALTAGATRYNDWLRAGPISSSVLTSRLNRLVEHAVLERVARSDRAARHEYRLTGRGSQMWPILLALWAWERRWVGERGDPLPEVTHTPCGQLVDPFVVCGACEARVVARDVRAHFGPSWTWARSIPRAATRRRAPSDQRPDVLVPQTMAVMGNRWSVTMLNCAFLGATRFGEFEQQTGAAPRVVADRLRTFCELGLMDESPSPSRPDWVTYHLAPKGLAFFPVLAEVVEWGQRWFHAPEGSAIEQEHSGCGARFHPRLACDRCGGRLRRSELELRTGGP